MEINDIEALIVILLLFLTYLKITDRAFRKPRGTKIMEDIFTLKTGVKVYIFFYCEYEIMDVKTPPNERQIASLSAIGIGSILEKKKGYKKLNKEKLGKKASKIAKANEILINPKHDLIGEMKITVEEIRRATPEDIEKAKNPAI